MSKTAQRRRQLAARRSVWAVHVGYADGTGQVDVFASKREAERMVDIVNAVKLREPQSITSIELFREGGAA